MFLQSLGIATALAAAAVLGAGIVLQLLLAAGQPLGHLAWGGRHAVLPTHLRLLSGAAAVLFAFAAWLVLARVGLFPVVEYEQFVRTATWGLAGLFALETVMHLRSRSPSERRTMAGVSLFLCLAFVIVAVG